MTNIMRNISVFMAVLMLMGTTIPIFAESKPLSDLQDTADSYSSPNNDLSFSAPSTQQITVYFDGEQLNFDAEPEIVNNRTFVPMRAILEALGADIEWSDSRKEVTATSGFDMLILKIGSKVAIHNTDAEMLDAAPYIKDSRTMMPLRYLSESLNYDVQWDASSRRIDINSGIYESDSDDSTDDKAITVLGGDADLTYNDAMKKAITNSASCKSTKVELSKAERQSEEFNNMYSMNYNFTIMQNRKDLKLLNDWSEKNVIVTEEQTAYSVTTEMDSISLKLLDIKNQQDAISYAKKKYNTAKLQYDNGSISGKTLNSALDEVTSAQRTLADYLTELDGLYIDLYNAIGENMPASVQDSDASASDIKSVTGDYMLPEFDINYEPIGELNMQQVYNEAIENDPYIWYVEHSAENADFKLITYEYNVAGKSYALTKMDLTSAQITASSTKSKLMKTLQSRYNQLIQIENSIDRLQDQLDTLHDNIDTMRVLYENGMKSKTDFEAVLQNESTIRNNIFKLQVQHEQLKTIFNKPYLAPEYMSS